MSEPEAGTRPRSEPEAKALPLTTLERWWGGSVALAAMLAVVRPMFGPLEADSFPLSTFPMFAHHRGQPRMHQLVGITQDDATRRLTPAHLGTSEVLQAKALIDRAARNPQRRRSLCREVAERVAADPGYAAVNRLEFLRVRYDPIRYFAEGPEPVERTRLAQCRVKRGANGHGTAATDADPKERP